MRPGRTVPAPSGGARPCRSTATKRTATAVRLRLALGAVTLGIAGCSGHEDVLAPASHEARHIGSLWWVYLLVTGIIFGLVVLAVLGAIWRAQRLRHALPAGTPLVVASTDPSQRRVFSIVLGCTVATVIVLFTLLVFDFRVGQAIQPPGDPNPLTIKVTGHQWWWQLEYDDPAPSMIIVTANELHLPLGRPVKLLLNSTDVIHSFWIPNLQGKKDLIPGDPTTLWITPDRIGRYHGQCAEFCGLQHAHMRLLVVVESPEDFARWQEAQRQAAPEPQTASQRRGRDVFLTTSCVLCHTIQGTPAGSRVGPPLTHIASQEYIASGSFPNRRGYLAGWIVDPQSMKPGVRMPQNLLGADDLNALLDYLETLR